MKLQESKSFDRGSRSVKDCKVLMTRQHVGSTGEVTVTTEGNAHLAAALQSLDGPAESVLSSMDHEGPGRIELTAAANLPSKQAMLGLLLDEWTA